MYVSLAVCIGALTNCHHTLRSANGIDVVSGEPGHELVVTAVGDVVDVGGREQVVGHVGVDAGVAVAPLHRGRDGGDGRDVLLGQGRVDVGVGLDMSSTNKM